MKKLIYILFLLLTSCTLTNQPTTPSTDNTETAPDTETIDTIVLTYDPTDPLVIPGMPLVTHWPKPYTTFYGHLVIFTDSLSPRVAQLTLLSLQDWADISSANSTTNPTQALDTASAYSELGLTQWSIPSETLARRMKSDLNPDTLNTHLSQLSHLSHPSHLSHITYSTHPTSQPDTLTLNARYLCENATKTFSLAPNTNVTTAGAKTLYRLRLVKTLKIARH